MSDWTKVPLEQVAPKEEPEFPTDEEKSVWEVSLADIEPETGRLLERDTTQVSDLGPSKVAFDERNVLYSKLRPYLNKVLVPDKFGVGSSELVPLRPNPDVLDRKYLAYYLRSPLFVAFANNNTTGANLPRMSMRALREHEIPLPSLDVQRRIVTVLDRADALRTKRRQFFERLPSLTQSFYIDLFGDPFENPKDWKTCELGDVVEQGPRNGLYRPQDDYGSGTPIIRIDSFYGGEIVDPENLKRVEIDDETRQKYLVEEGDILINRVNSREYLGKSALVRDLPEPTVFESNMMRLRLDRDLIEPGYLIGLLQQEYINRQIQTAAKDAVNQSSINQSDVKEFEIRVPPLELQRKYVELRNRIRGTQKRAKRHQKRVDDLFNVLLHRAFRGELELNETAFKTETEPSPSEENGRPDKATVAQGNLFSETA